VFRWAIAHPLPEDVTRAALGSAFNWDGPNTGIKFDAIKGETTGRHESSVFFLAHTTAPEIDRIKENVISPASPGLQTKDVQEHAEAEFARRTMRHRNFPNWWNTNALPDADVVRVNHTWFIFSKSTGLIYVYRE